MPEVLVAGGDGLGASVTMTQGEMECDHAVASLGIGLDKGWAESGSPIDGAMPEILVAGGDRLDACVAVVDGKIERSDAIATLRVGEGGRLDR